MGYLKRIEITFVIFQSKLSPFAWYFLHGTGTFTL